MLKISSEETTDGLAIKLAGRLAGAWVDELERVWYERASKAAGRQVIVDLSEVTFVDAEGKKLLAWIFRQGADFRASGCMTRCIVEEVKQAAQTY
jgi:anti-anti-sigma regulatory factor